MDPITVTVTITGDTVATAVAVDLPRPGNEQATIDALREAADLLERWHTTGAPHAPRSRFAQVRLPDPVITERL